MRPKVALLAAAACLLVATPSSAAEPVPSDFWGVQPFDLPTVEEAGMMRHTGVDVARVQFDWRGIEERPPWLGYRFYKWAKTDAWVGNLARGGVAGHGLLIGGPGYLTPTNAHSPMSVRDGPRGWRLYVRAVVDRYGVGGDFWAQNPQIPKRPIRIFQVWNEQNSAARYKPSPDVREYADMLRIAAEEVRANDPGARVVLGGMFGTPNDIDNAVGSMPAWDYLEQLYAIPGAAGWFDAVAVHPYSPDLRGVRYQLREIRKVMRAAGDGATPLEVTELGWSSGSGNAFFFFVGPKGQAQLLERSFRLILKKREAWNIDRVIWLSWRDTVRYPGCGYCDEFGLLERHTSPKASYHLYKEFALGRYELDERSKGKNPRKGKKRRKGDRRGKGNGRGKGRRR